MFAPLTPLDPFTVRREHREDGITVLEPVGALDILSARQLKAELLTTLQPGARVVLSLAAVRVLDSVGLTLLNGFCRRAAEGDVSLALASVAHPAAHVLALTGIDRKFRIFPSVETAIQAA